MTDLRARSGRRIRRPTAIWSFRWRPGAAARRSSRRCDGSPCRRRRDHGARDRARRSCRERHAGERPLSPVMGAMRSWPRSGCTRLTMPATRRLGILASARTAASSPRGIRHPGRTRRFAYANRYYIETETRPLRRAATPIAAVAATAPDRARGLRRCVRARKRGEDELAANGWRHAGAKIRRRSPLLLWRSLRGRCSRSV